MRNMMMVMRNMMMVMCVAVFCGCASTSAQMPSQTAATNIQKPEPKQPDNFDKAGQAVADSSRWVYNESIQAWQWMTSDTNKERAKKIVNTVEEMAKGALEYGEKEWNKK